MPLYKDFPVEFRLWNRIKRGCSDPRNEQYHLYGLIGIKICDRWKNNFSSFLQDIGQRPSPDFRLRRLDNTKDFEPTNVEWYKDGRRSRGSENHGLSQTTEYTIWNSMIQRCTNPNATNYLNYGSRGINICERWKDSFPNFIEDMGLRPSKEYTLDRKDNNSDYTPENCKWSIWEEQHQDKRIRKDNTSGHTGISILPDGRCHVRCGINHQQVLNQVFNTFEEALAARLKFEDQYRIRSL